MKKELSFPLLIILTLLLPPIGAYFVCTDSRTGSAARLAACVYALAAIIVVLIWHPGCGDSIIEAESISKMGIFFDNILL